MEIFGFLHMKEKDDGVDTTDADAVRLSHVGTAAYDLLRTKHNQHHHQLWNVTTGKVMRDVHYTPKGFWNPPSEVNDPDDGHSDWFPGKMCEIMSKTQVWCDVMSLSPPDGLFMAKFNEALKAIAKTAEQLPKDSSPIYIRMMFGHIVSQPVNCTAVLKQLTKGISSYANICVWVGAWRSNVQCWNHAKMIAVDGRHLHTGGHNCWDSDYLQSQPVHDLSLELEGKVTQDAHRFANGQWNFLKKTQKSLRGWLIKQFPDSSLLPTSTRVTVTEFPLGVAKEFPPEYKSNLVPKHYKYPAETEGVVPIISMGKQGALVRDLPSEDAFGAMFDAAKTSIRCAQQDIGPRTIGDTKIPMPGFSWPKKHLEALGRALKRGVCVEIVLSNQGAKDNGGYANGWTCEDVAAEIIRTIPKQYPDDADESMLRNIVAEQLRICFLCGKFGNTWKNGQEIALHSKHFIVDDICTYIGSENIYAFNLAEWGVVIDDPTETRNIMSTVWTPMWECSYIKKDFGVDEVMNGLDIDRDAVPTDGDVLDADTKKALDALQARKKTKSAKHLMALAQGPMPKKSELYEEEN